jgi:hypothetical protein
MLAQEKSVKPGINDPFKEPDVGKFATTFEGESREVFLQREKVVNACGLVPYHAPVAFLVEFLPNCHPIH